MHTLGLLLDEFTNPYLDFYYLAGDEVSKIIQDTHEMAKQERELCDNLCRKFGAVAAELPNLFRPERLVQGIAPINLYFRENEQPQGWQKRSRSEIWNAGHSAIRLSDNWNEWAPAYEPDEGTDDAKNLLYAQKLLHKLRGNYCPTANTHIGGGTPGDLFRWHNIMWGSKFDLPLNEYGFSPSAPLIYPVCGDYILGFSLRSSELKSGQHRLPAKFSGQLTEISERTFRALQDRQSSVSSEWRLEQVKKGRSGLCIGDRVRFRYVM